MLIQLEYPDIWELRLKKIEAVDKNRTVIATFVFHTEDNTWRAILNVTSEKCIYKLVLNEEIYINDPYANEYIVQDKEVWSVRYQEGINQESEIEPIEGFDITVSGQMNRAVTAAKSQKIFYAQYEKRVNVGVEFYSVLGVHELVVVWESPQQQVYHIDYKVVEPEIAGERYGMMIWFKLLLDEIGREQQKGIWTTKILLDGRLIGFEPFSILDNYLNDL